MHEPITIDFTPDNRDVYRTLDGLGLFGFRFEQDARDWTIYAHHLPAAVAAALMPSGDPRREIRIEVHQPLQDLRQAKAYAAQWAEQAWEKGRATVATNDRRIPNYQEEHPS